MWNKIFFWTVKEVKYAKCAAVFAVIITLLLLSRGEFTSGLLAQDSAGNTNSDSQTVSVRQAVNLILDNSIFKLRNSRNYAVDIRTQADICGQTFNGKGIYRQTSQIDSMTGKRTYSVRWEMEYFMEECSQYSLQVLNGERKKLWTQNERRSIRPDQKTEYGDLEVIDLNEVLRVVSSDPQAYQPIASPWFSVFHVDQLLEGIRQNFSFTIAGITNYPGTRRALYRVQGVLKPEIAFKINNRKNAGEANSNVISMNEEYLCFLSQLADEVPTHIEFFIDKELEFPVYVHFFRKDDEQNEGINGETAPRLRFVISFENTYLNNATFRSEEFEIMPENVTKDSTENFIQSLKK